MSQCDSKFPKKTPVQIHSGQQFGKLTVIKNVGYPSYVTSRINYYLCQCSCGVQKEIRRNHLLSGRTTSCGCGVREKNLKAKGQISYTALYNICRRSALTRNLSFTLTREQHKKLITLPCNYCGELPKYYNTTLTKAGYPKAGRTPVEKERAAIYINGIDRIDSNKGYDVDNCTPCCTNCNRAKWTLSIKEYLDHCIKVVNFNKKG